ncbi:LuxR C-terminal-related transcriptional regulator [Pseudomonas sp. LS44]|uniref:LuxR C-terminal-related transcriptional regulator n=1 Tax=Pseudomonas sp. LS44 TaxID=1357074 RepID=UPI00215B3789|nr:LuxR C-terminal-related transcriptional regulator [Pseudomonas sp. LS44]UVE16126.1 LuxR C-terminal-related transcriptional regulator [Pseudomonas sp. LS44]
MFDRPDLLARLSLIPTVAEAPAHQAWPDLTETGNAGPSELHIHPTKFSVPRAVTSPLPRHALLQRMSDADAPRLILISAAAGFGKTTLLRLYREHCLAQGRRVLWLNLDAADNQPRRLAAHLRAGLQPGESVRGDETSLLTYLGSLDEPFSILLDDFEALTAPAALDFIRRLLEALPACGSLVIASRTTPDISLGRLRAQGQVLEIGTAALRFTPEETATYLRETCGLELDDSEVASLQHSTEGWITALYLATLSLQGRSDRTAFIHLLSGSSLELADYLAEDILANQSEELRNFLLQTSILDDFCVPLCDELLGSHNSQALIDQLERANLFIQPTDPQRHWYRYHRLFREFLSHALERQLPGQAEHLHRRAAQWYLKTERPLAAIEQHLQATDWAAGAELLDRQLDALVDAGRLRLLLRWLERLPADVLDVYPRLVLSHAWTLLLDRRYQHAMRVVERHPAGPEIQAIRCLLLALTDQLDAALALGQTQIERLSPHDGLQYSIVATPLAFCLVYAGRYDDARHILTEMAHQGSQGGRALLGGIATYIESTLELTQGHLRDSSARLEAARLTETPEQSSKWGAGKPTLDILRAVVLYEGDELVKAGHILAGIPADALDIAGSDSLITRLVLLARIALQLGDRDAWLHHLAELEQLGRGSGSMRILCAVWLERTRVATLEDRLDIAAQALHSAELSGGWVRPDRSTNSCDTDTPFIARQRLQIARGQYREAVTALRPAIETALQYQHYRRALKLRLLLAMAQAGTGRRKDALTTLTAALQLASKEGFLRTFLDEGAALEKLMRSWAVSFQALCSSLNISPAFITDLLHRYETQHGAKTTPQADLQLTAREIDVIRLLAAGNRNRAIAEQMCLSEHTVKSHLRSVSGKLGAKSRTEVLAIARAHGLLD